MKRYTVRAATVLSGAAAGLMLVLASPQAASSRAATLEECQSMKDRVDHYTVLRRKGGSAGKMEGWKKQLRKAEAKFREEGCHRYLRKLK